MNSKLTNKLTNIKKVFFALVVGFLMLTSFNVMPNVQQDGGGIGDVSVVVGTDGKMTMTGGGMSSVNSGTAITNLITKYRNVIVGMSAVGAVTMIAFFILNFLKLGATATNPSERAKVLQGLVWSGLAAAGLGSVSFIVGFFYYAMVDSGTGN